MDEVVFAKATIPGPEVLEARLLQELARVTRPVLAYSGGVDSSYLLAVLRDARPERDFAAVLGVSPSLSKHQLELARATAGFLGVSIEEVQTAEFEREEYRRNQGDRCFFCKDELFLTLRRRFPDSTLLDGTHAEDVQGHRPGKEAARLYGVRSPLLDFGFTKTEVRELSRRRSLPTAELPASPCLSSRFPAGEPVTEEGLRTIEAAEEILRSLGFAVCRVRHHGALARVEIPFEELPRVAGTELGREIHRRLAALGYSYVSFDLAGFRSGSSSHLPGFGV